MVVPDEVIAKLSDGSSGQISIRGGAGGRQSAPSRCVKSKGNPAASLTEKEATT
jgi:hypothetical protein